MAFYPNINHLMESIDACFQQSQKEPNIANISKDNLMKDISDILFCFYFEIEIFRKELYTKVDLLMENDFDSNVSQGVFLRKRSDELSNLIFKKIERFYDVPLPPK